MLAGMLDSEAAAEDTLGHWIGDLNLDCSGLEDADVEGLAFLDRLRDGLLGRGGSFRIRESNRNWKKP